MAPSIWAALMVNVMINKKRFNLFKNQKDLE